MILFTIFQSVVLYCKVTMWLWETASSETWNGLGSPYSFFFVGQAAPIRSASEILNPGCTSMNLQFLCFTSRTQQETDEFDLTSSEIDALFICQCVFAMTDGR